MDFIKSAKLSGKNIKSIKNYKTSIKKYKKAETVIKKYKIICSGKSLKLKFKV